MKETEKTFYTINLDNKRILVLSVIFLLVIIYSFMLGLSIGKKQNSNGENVSSAELEKAYKEKAPIKVEDELSDSTKEKKLEEVELTSSRKKEKTDKSELLSAEVIDGESKQKAKKNKKITTIGSEDEVLYTIQLGAFSSIEQANKLKDTISNIENLPKKYAPYIIRNNDLYIVRVGNSPKKENLEKIVDRLKSAGTTPIIKKVDK